MPKRKAAAAHLDVPRRSKRLVNRERANKNRQSRESQARKTWVNQALPEKIHPEAPNADAVQDYESQNEDSQDAEPQDEEPQYPKASLLGMPGELRNRIYRYVLVKAKPIRVTPISNGNEYPGLITLSRQIYSETVNIFLQENKFDVQILDYKPRVPLGSEHWVLKTRAKRIIFIGQRKSWANLKEWIRRWHAGEHVYTNINADVDIDSNPLVGSTAATKKMAARAFQIVVPIKELSWSKVEAVLEKFKTSTGEAGFVWD